MIYLASPYAHEKESVRRDRFVQACRAAAVLMERDIDVFSPIAHSHPVAEWGKLDGMDHDFWMRRDLPLLRRCDKLLVLQLDGWQESRGIAVEIAEAERLQMPVDYCTYETIEQYAETMKREAPFTAALTKIELELRRATGKFGSFASPHEGIAVIREEVLELEREIFLITALDPPSGDPKKARSEAVQVAAMAIRFMVDCTLYDGIKEAVEDVAAACPQQCWQAYSSAHEGYAYVLERYKQLEHGVFHDSGMLAGAARGLAVATIQLIVDCLSGDEA